MTAGDRPSLGRRRLDTADRLATALDVVLVVALAWVLWIVVDTSADQLAAVSGRGETGVIVIDGTRHGYRSTIPVGTFTAQDGTRTTAVAWQTQQGEGVELGDRLEAVRVGGRAWPPDAGFGAWDVAVLLVPIVVILWRLLAIARRLRGPVLAVPSGLPPG